MKPPARPRNRRLRTLATLAAATLAVAGASVLVSNLAQAAETTVQGASTADGGRVVQYADRGGANQQWQLVRAG
jgi:hypothetical protein